MDADMIKKLGDFFKLIGAVGFGDVDKVKEMLDKGVDVNSRFVDLNYEGENNLGNNSAITETDTPLLVAVKSTANPEIIKILLEYGADSSIRDENGNTAIEIIKNRKEATDTIIGLFKNQNT